MQLKKAKVSWSVEGDENSKFFHGMLKKRRRQKMIRGIFWMKIGFKTQRLSRKLFMIFMLLNFNLFRGSYY